MPDAENFACKFSQSGPEGQVKMFEDRCSQLVSVATLWGEDRCDCTRVLLRNAADDFQTPLQNRRTDCFSMTFVSAKYVRQSFFSNHLQSLSQAVNEVRGGRIREKSRFTRLQHSLPVPITPWHFGSFIRQQGLLRNRVKTQTGRNHQALLRGRDCYIYFPLVMVILYRTYRR